MERGAIQCQRAFPTAVGMNRPFAIAWFQPMRVPHSRGDEPEYADTELKNAERSPQPWG